MIGRRGFLTLAGAASITAARPGWLEAEETAAKLAHAQAFFKGRTVRVIIPAGAGSGTDRSSRQFLAALTRLMPETRLRIENIERSAGQVGASQLWRGERDGSVVGFPRSNLFYAELLNRETLDFRFREFTFFGSFTQAHRVLVLRNDGEVQDIGDILSGRKIVLKSSDSVTSGHHYEAILMNAISGSRIRPVPGYAGGARNMAVISGEVDCQIGTIEAVQPILDAGAGHIVFRLSSAPLLKDMPDVPRLIDHLRDQNLEWAVGLIDAAATVGRPFAGPPGMQQEAKAHWETLFETIVSNASFRNEARETEGLIIDPTPGSEITSLLTALSARGAELQDEIEALMTCGQLLSTSLQSSCS